MIMFFAKREYLRCEQWARMMRGWQSNDRDVIERERERAREPEKERERETGRAGEQGVSAALKILIHPHTNYKNIRKKCFYV